MIFYKLRLNKSKGKGKLELWPGSSANDYVYRSEDLEEYCAFELAMDFEKRYNTYKEVDEMLVVARDGTIEAYKTLEMGMNDLRK